MRQTLFSIVFVLLISNLTFAQKDIVPGDKVVGDKVAGDKVMRDKIIYQNIQNIIQNPSDQSLLFLGFQLADLQFDTTHSKRLRDKCSSLNELCLNSIKDEKFYSKNKSKISDLIVEIFKLQQDSFKESFIRKAKADYDNTIKNNYLASISYLKSINDDDSAMTFLVFFEQTIYNAWNVDSTYFLSNLVRDHFTLLIDALCKRLERTSSIAETNKLFTLMNSFIQAEYNTKWDSYILLKVNDVLTSLYKNSKIYLGQLLLEGYKDYLNSRNGKIPRSPTEEDLKSVYKFIFPVSNESTLARNIILAQIMLLMQGDLKCNQKIINKIERGFNWEEKKGVYKIPFLMLNRTISQLMKESQIGDRILTLNDYYFDTRDSAIKMFNYKFDKFSDLQRIGRDVFNFISSDEQKERYSNCDIINNVYYPRLYNYTK